MIKKALHPFFLPASAPFAETFRMNPKQWIEALLAYLCGQAWRFRTLCAAAEDFVSHFHKLLRISTPA
jgi:hypothetical protein